MQTPIAVHKCKENHSVSGIELWKGADAWMLSGDYEDPYAPDIKFCPYCGKRLKEEEHFHKGEVQEK